MTDTQWISNIWYFFQYYSEIRPKQNICEQLRACSIKYMYLKVRGRVQSSMSKKKKEIVDQLCRTPPPPNRELEKHWNLFDRYTLNETYMTLVYIYNVTVFISGRNNTFIIRILLKKKMQLDVDIEPTFKFSYMKCTDKQKDITMNWTNWTNCF